MSDWREEVLEEHQGAEPDQVIDIVGLDMSRDQFVDAALSHERQKLLDAVDELKRHQLYILAARETVNEWSQYPDKITPAYLGVVQDILATAEKVLGISYESVGCDDESVTEVSPSEGVRE
jgi:hypothetical protein